MFNISFFEKVVISHAYTTTPTKLGLNELEAQLLGFPQGNLSTPNLVKHLVRNITGIQVVGGNKKFN